MGSSSVFCAEPKRFSGLTPPRLFDIEKVIPALKPYRRKAIRLHPTRAAAPLPSNASKMGGLFHWPAQLHWPYCHETDPVADRGRMVLDLNVKMMREIKLVERVAELAQGRPEPTTEAGWQNHAREIKELENRERAKGLPQLNAGEMAEAQRSTREVLQKLKQEEVGPPHNTNYQGLVQLRRDEFPELPWPQGMDLFQLLWCPKVHLMGNSLVLKSSQSNGSRVLWRKESEVGEVLAQQSPGTERFPIHECSFQPEETVEYPQAEETAPEIAAAIPQLQGWFDALQARRSNDPGAAWHYSYDIAAAPGTKLLGYSQWIQGREIPKCSCGRAMKLLLTCASDEILQEGVWESRPASGEQLKSREEVQRPFGFQWGAWSNAYVFYCSTGHPIHTAQVVQSS